VGGLNKHTHSERLRACVCVCVSGKYQESEELVKVSLFIVTRDARCSHSGIEVFIQ